MNDLDNIDDLQVIKEVKSMVALSSAKATDSIAVVGPQSLEYIIALFRSGFECATCISADSPRACGDPIDHLFVSGPLGDAQLARVVASVGRRLGPDGAIVAQLRDARQDQVVSQALGDAGLFELPPRVEGPGGVLTAHRLYQPDPLAIAA